MTTHAVSGHVISGLGALGPHSLRIPQVRHCMEVALAQALSEKSKAEPAELATRLTLLFKHTLVQSVCRIDQILPANQIEN